MTIHIMTKLPSQIYNLGAPVTAMLRICGLRVVIANDGIFVMMCMVIPRDKKITLMLNRDCHLLALLWK